MKNMKIEVINETTARVSKAFEKNAKIFGTPEYKLWREYLKEFPNATMTTKEIKKNANKKTYRNMTYKNMETYMEQFDNSEELLTMFSKVKKMSKPLASPYKYVSDWFEAQFPDFRDCPNLEAGDKEVEVMDAPDTDNYKPKEAA